MKKRIGFKTLKSRLIFWFLLVALLPLIAVSTVISLQRTRVIKETAFHKLTAIRDLKVDQLNNWIDERISDLRVISLDREIRALSEVLNEKATEKNVRIIRHATERLNHYVAAYKSYEELFLINPLTGKIEISTNEARIGTDKSRNTNFTEPMRTGGPYIKDIYYSKTIHRPTMTFSIPIYGRDKNITGILVSLIDLENSLYKLLLDRIGMVNTGETLIINQDVVALNELRWYPDAPLKLNIKARPALMASQGKTGITETPDYRGEEVLAAYTFIPRARWGFVAKQDLKEIYAPVQAMFIHILVVLLISAVAVYLLALFVARIFARPVLEMTETSRKIQEGDLTARNTIESSDEIGFLADSFNNLADAMGSQIQVQGAVAHVNDTMVAAKDMTGFASQILKTLVDTTGSIMGAFYLLTSDGSRFEHCASIGISPELLEPFDASAAEGELGKAALTKEISHIKDIPEDTIFTFRTFTGTVLPKEMITVPLMINERVSGMISLAALQPYSKEAVEILNLIWLSISTALSNLMAGEETRKLAEALQSKNQELEAQTEELQAQAEELEAQSEELQQTSDELQQRSEELQEQNVELETQRNQVEEANRLKSEFLSNMSHELRTPLNSVMALSRVLIMQTKEKLSEEEANYLEIIERNGKQLLALINDILDLSKIEAGRMDVSPKLFSIKSTIETITESLEPLAEEKGVEITQQIPEDLPRIESDESRVHQILQNIIGNGVKFTNKGSVTVSASSDTEKVYIKVKDTGIGISNKDLPHIFEEFRQVDGSSSRPFEGTGLGLTIAYKAAKMLGGDIFVESTPGKGSTFKITLPIKWEGIAAVYKPITERPPSETLGEGQKTILIVDDEPNVVAMISEYLTGEGYNTLTATSGRKALELAEIHRPFAITLDVIMPEMDGWEVLQNLKKNPVTADIPVIIVSVSDDRDTGFALGAVGSITKPFTRDALIAEINKIGRPRPHSIMVVDDNEIDLREMARVIEKEGIKAVPADSGSNCVEMLKEDLPDILVLDLMMPEMDGFEVLDRVRTNPKTGNLPVIIVTAKDLTSEDRKRLKGSVSSILAKSDTTSKALLEEIKKILIKIEGHAESPKDKRAKRDTRILLVEDNESSVIQVKSTLESEGFIVDVARDGENALDYMKRSIPDGIILDLMMPGIDGFEVLEKVRSTKATAGIPVLILTAKDLTPDDLKRLKSNNIQQLIQKGDIDRQDLLNKTRQMLGLIPATRIKGQKSGKTRNSQLATILVVEDNPDNLITIKAVLQNRYEILEATDGEAGLKTALAELPALVLLDMSLPKMDGFEVVRNIKEDENARHIPVIALTARAMKGDREKTMEAGCDDYISKPIDPEEILAKIEKWAKKG